MCVGHEENNIVIILIFSFLCVNNHVKGRLLSLEFLFLVSFSLILCIDLNVGQSKFNKGGTYIKIPFNY